MAEEAGPSTSADFNIDVENADEKAEFPEELYTELSNVLRVYATSMHQRGIPPETFSAAYIALAETLSSKVTEVINDHYLLKQEELILFDETDDKGLYEECKDDPVDHPEDSDYDPQDFKEPHPDYIPLNYKAKVLALADQHPKWNLKTLQKRGASRLKRKDYLIQWRKDVKRVEQKSINFEKLIQTLLNALKRHEVVMKR